MDLLLVLLTCLLGQATATLELLNLHKWGLLHPHAGYAPIIYPIGLGPSGFNHGFALPGFGHHEFGGNINPGFGGPVFGGNFATSSASAGSFNGINTGFSNSAALASAQSGIGGFGGSNAIASAQAGGGFRGHNTWPGQYAPVNSYGTPTFR